MREYPYTTADGTTRWACCESVIGPTCKHLEGLTMPKIVTNNHERPLITWEELTDKEREWFDYPSSSESLFFRYRGWAYDFYDMPIAPDSLKALGWDGALADTAWTAVVVRCFDRDGYALDGVVVGYYVS